MHMAVLLDVSIDPQASDGLEWKFVFSGLYSLSQGLSAELHNENSDL